MKAIGSPFLALKLFFTRPRLFALGVFPGVFTFAASCAAVYWVWLKFLQEQNFWLALLTMMATLFLSWTTLGKIALLPVEDALIDECQRALWNEVRFIAAPFRWKRIGRDLLAALAGALLALVLLALSFVPLLAPLVFLCSGWIGSFSFLSPLYTRRAHSFRGQLTLFFRHPVANALLGIFLNFLLFVPVVNVFLLGYAQVLAALVHLQRETKT